MLFLLIFETQSAINRLGIHQVTEFVLYKSAFLLVFDAQSPIKRLGIYQVAELALCKRPFFYY